jgi:hypothetical protein
MSRLTEEQRDQLMRDEVQTLIDDIAERLSEGKQCKFVNDHNNQTEILQGYVILDDMYLCPVIKDTRCYCLNPLYIDTKKQRVHLSRGSVGGNVYNMYHDMDSVKAIEAYKKRAEESKFMKKVTDYRVF